MRNTNYMIAKIVKNGLDALAIIDINSHLDAKFFLSFSNDELNVYFEYINEENSLESMHSSYKSVSLLSTDNKVDLINDIVTDYPFDGIADNKLPSFSESELETIFEIVSDLE